MTEPNQATRRERGHRRSVFSGIQPTGVVHIGNYVGAIRHWAGMLDDYDCTFCVVDLHAMTVPYEPQEMPQKVFETFIINIAAGLDPERCCLFVQSHVPQVTELCWMLMTCSSMGELSRMTQFKDKSEKLGGQVSAGLFTYPVLMAADILLYKAEVVPVGEDQTQHLEFAREAARAFNARFGETFPEPEALFSEVPRLMGLDNKQKMSKSLDNHISLLEDRDEIWAKLSTAATDPARVRRADPGTPEICNIFTMHKAFSPPEDIEWSAHGCRTASIGCLDCKRRVTDNMAAELEPVREKYRELAADPGRVREIMAEGAENARQRARTNLAEARRSAGLL
ncbi:MAG: tryptophanyl-tRNA synthetase [Planctomycetes bacterium SM23_32]|nr:MAG: tryptophanyl-tRNA synthetase [Planctomycetes bacterium SM23_32]